MCASVPYVDLQDQATKLLGIVRRQARRGFVLEVTGTPKAGKTTSIRMILRILDPDSGTVTYNGASFTKATRDILGYLPEERGLYKKSRLIDTLLYLAELRGLQRSKARVAVMTWLERLGLRDAAQRKVEELSKGNQQKVQFIGAVLHDPAGTRPRGRCRLHRRICGAYRRLRHLHPRWLEAPALPADAIGCPRRLRERFAVHVLLPRA